MLLIASSLPPWTILALNARLWLTLRPGPVTNVSAGCHGRSDLGGTIARVGTEPSGAVRYGILGPLSVATDIGPTRMASRAPASPARRSARRGEPRRVCRSPSRRIVGRRRPVRPRRRVAYADLEVAKVLPPTVSLVTEEGGYRLLVAPERLHAVRSAARAGAARPLQAGAASFGRGVGAVAGRVLEEFADRPFAQPEVRRLEELHGAAREDRTALLLAADRAAEAAAT